MGVILGIPGGLVGARHASCLEFRQKESAVWKCPECSRVLEERFQACWSCGTSKEGVRDPDFESHRVGDSELPSQRGDLTCVRCDRDLDYLGARSFHEGARLGVFGNLFELFVNREAFDLYVCSECGHVEFFAQGLGDR